MNGRDYYFSENSRPPYSICYKVFAPKEVRYDYITKSRADKLLKFQRDMKTVGQYFWSFDNKFISIFQSINIQSRNPAIKILAYILYIVTKIIFAILNPNITVVVINCL